MSVMKTVKGSLGKTARLEARVTLEQKQVIQHAADIEGRSLTDFMLYNLQSVAQKIIQDQTVMELSPNDSKIFVESLLNPPKPSDNLKKAVRRYKRLSKNK